MRFNIYFKKHKLRLFIRRAIVCVCLATAVYLIAAGAVAMVQAVQREAKSLEPQQPKPTAALPESAGQSPPVPSSAAAAAPRVESNAASSKPAGYFDDAVFIGDSRTEGLEIYDGLDNAAYYAVKGLMVNTIFTKPAVEVGGKKLTVMQAISGQKFGKIYIMLGINELGWSSSATFIQDYGKVIDEIKKDQPNAKIYVQSILPVSAKKAQSDKIYSNANIVSHNQMIREMTVKKGVAYLDVASAVSDSKGNLPEKASVDGVHLNQEYCKKWCEYLRTRAK